MFIALLKNGKYEFCKTEEKIMSLIDKCMYIIIDISTTDKANAYTLVKAERFIPYNKIDEKEYRITISAFYTDYPEEIDESHTIPITIDSTYKKYSIYPSIQQITLGNIYAEDVLVYNDGSLQIFVSNVTRIDKKTNDIESIDLVDYYENDELTKSSSGKKKIKKFYEPIKTDVKNVLSKRKNISHCYNSHIILYNDNTWAITDLFDIKNKFKYILFNIPSAETLFLLSKDQYYGLMSISKLSLWTLYLSADLDENILDFSDNDIEEILRDSSCYYYELEICDEIIITNNGNKYNLSIGKNHINKHDILELLYKKIALSMLYEYLILMDYFTCTNMDILLLIYPDATKDDHLFSFISYDYKDQGMVPFTSILLVMAEKVYKASRDRLPF